jgi:DNA-binding GntR family transcriptional regulator
VHPQSDSRPEFTSAPAKLAESLRAEIIFLDLIPGSRVVEEEIAERFQVSRSPVREAIRLLEMDGLVVIEERRGARVAAISKRHLDEVYSCRIPLEGLAADRAATNRTYDTLHKLEVGLQELDAAFTTHEDRVYFQASIAFSEKIYAAADDITLRRLVRSVGNQALRYRYLAYRRFPHLMDRSVEGNRDIYQAIKVQDGHRARELTERLIEKSWMAIRDCIS